MLTDCKVTGNTGAVGGGGVYNFVDTDGGLIALANCTISANAAPSNQGGGVASDIYGGLITLSNCSLTRNTAYSGGGIANYSGEDNNGGAITLNNCSLDGNAATNGGSGMSNDISNNGGTFTLTNDIVYGDAGSEVLNSDGAVPAISYCDIQGGSLGTGNIDKDPLFVNAATDDLHLNPSSPCLGKGTSAGAPSTDKDGRTRPNPPSIGAYELAATLTLSPQNPTIQSVITIALSGDTILVPSGTFTGPGNVDWDFGGKNITVSSANGAANTIIDCGGAPSTDGSGNHRGFYVHDGETNAVISGFTIKNGYEAVVPGVPDSGYGGNLCVDGSSVAIQKCVFEGGTAALGGGGVAVIGKGHHSSTFTNCVFNKNTAPKGGAVLINNDTGTAALTNCTVTGNTAQQGGGISNQNSGGNGSVALATCSVSGNTAQTAGGGIYNENDQGSDTITLLNCSVSGNDSPIAGGVYNDNYAGSTIALINDIVYDDTGGEVDDSALNMTPTQVSYSDIQGGFAGTTNINKDPLFVSFTSGDLHLKTGSPCLGAGSYDTAPPTDLDGNLRPNPPSIGAYELIIATTRAVLLVHGTFGNGQAWNQKMLPTLKSQGFIVEAVDFPTEPETYSNEAKIEEQAAALKRRIGALLTSSGQPSVALVCHSMGGLAARYYLEHQELWQTDAQGNAYSGVSKLVMLGTPNWGTDSPELDPVAGISAAHLTTEPLGRAVDTYSNWSPAISEQFAEWEPAPEYKGFGFYSYPSGYQLYQWPSSFVGFGSPINPLSYLYDDYVSGKMLYDGLPSDSADVLAATVKFPIFLRLRNLNHLSYYPVIAHSLGVAYPSSAGVHGVNNRLVSPFLFALNQQPIVSGVKVYLVAGTNPIASYFPIHNLAVAVHGPFATNMANDGIVPTQSELGIDPITHDLLFPDAEHYTINTYHADLPNNADVVSHVVNWLSQ